MKLPPDKVKSIEHLIAIYLVSEIEECNPNDLDIFAEETPYPEMAHDIVEIVLNEVDNGT